MQTEEHARHHGRVNYNDVMQLAPASAAGCGVPSGSHCHSDGVAAQWLLAGPLTLGRPHSA